MRNACHSRYARHRFPAEVISLAVWLYFRFPLSLRLWRAVDQDRYVLDEIVQSRRNTKAAKRLLTNSHVPLRKRERMMQGFRSVGGVQRFTSVFSAVRDLFVSPHPYQSALATHLHRLQAMATWEAAAGVLA